MIHAERIRGEDALETEAVEDRILDTRAYSGLAEAKLHWSGYRYLYPSAYVSVYAEARWVWGLLPQENFFNLML